MKLNWKLVTSAGLLTLAASSMAQTAFVERKGVQEFSGRMIVKPLNPSDLQARGLAPSAAHRRAMEAWMRIEGTTIRQEEEVGEAIVLVPAGKTENQYARELMATGLYEYVTPDWKVYPSRKPNDALYAQQWHHPIIKSEGGWNVHTGGIGVTVAICDTGVELDHPDLQPLLVSGYNSADDKTQASGGLVTDIQGHGTHVAGCAAARGNNSIGVAGVTWNSRIMPIRITNAPEGWAYLTDQHRGARWAADNGARSINLSFGGVESPSSETTGAYIRSKNALFFVAGGNSREFLNGFDWPNVTVVSASNPADKPAGWCAYGRAVDLVAPGEGILSTVRGKGYEAYTGTSMATPIVAGVAALVMSLAPRLTATQVEQILFSTADLIGTADIVGNGRVNVQRAIAMANTQVTAPTSFNATAMSVTMGTLAGGTLDSLHAVDSNVVAVNSLAMPRVGHAAAVRTDFALPAGRVNSFEVFGTARITSSQPATLSLFLTNVATGRDELVSSASVGTFDSTIRFAVSPASVAKYVSSTGAVRATFRAYSADSRLMGPAAPFQFRVDRVGVTADIRS